MCTYACVKAEPQSPYKCLNRTSVFECACMTGVDSISLQSHVEQSVNFLPHILLSLHDKCLDFLITHSYSIIGHGRYIVQHTLSLSEYQIASVFI